MESHKPVQKIVIVGGGTAGWMCASYLANFFASDSSPAISITLIEADTIAGVGVGEATIPTIRQFYQSLGFTDATVMKATGATCKLGIEFEGWNENRKSFIHPFGVFGQAYKSLSFAQLWFHLHQGSMHESLEAYSLGALLAREGRFAVPNAKPKSQIEVFDWALHLDAIKFAELLQKYAIEKGVSKLNAEVTDTCLNSHTGEIESLQLDNTQRIEADIFVDCSGFRSLLLGKSLNTAYEDWSQWLLCDSAIAAQFKSEPTRLPRTIAKAKDSGWQWKIPLQHRIGSGYVYSSQFSDKESARKQLLQEFEHEPLIPLKEFSFTPGRRVLTWNKNCIGLGLAAGFLEPLESTSIALIQTSIERLAISIRDGSYTLAQVDKFNSVSKMEMERVRDFIILHYKMNKKTDNAFWKKCRELSIPDSLNEKITLFQEHAELKRWPWEIFGPDSWLALLNGLQVTVNASKFINGQIDSDFLHQYVASVKSSIHAAVSNAPLHNDFLSKNLGIVLNDSY